VEINDTLFAWLQWYVERYGIQGGPVSPSSSVWSVRVPMRKVHKKAAVKLKQNALRHSYASYHLAANKDIDALVIALGHRGNPNVLWEHYHRAVKASAAKEYWQIMPAAATGRLWRLLRVPPSLAARQFLRLREANKPPLETPGHAFFLGICRAQLCCRLALLRPISSAS
jgi:hypothetical protein